MKTVTDDRKLLHELDFFFQDDLDLYFNFKRNIDAAYTMKLTTESERNFIEHNTENYLLFMPKHEYCDTFLKYCHMGNATGTPYLFIHEQGRIASVFCENSEGIITHRKHIFDLNEIYDIYYSFAKHLWKYKPSKAITQHITTALKLSMTKEAVAV